MSEHHSEHGFTFLSHIPGLEHFPLHVVTAILISTLLIVTTWIARMQLKRARAAADGALIPDEKLTYRNFFEIAAESLFNFAEGIMGRDNTRRFFPLIGSLFVYIFVNNLLGLIPGFLPATQNMNTTLAIGTVVFVYYNAVGFKENGFGYLKHFMGPVWWLAPLLLPIELISHIMRPFTLGLRLRANIDGDHQVLAAFSQLNSFPVPIIFMGFGLFVSFVQAFVFTLLTMVYISMASAHDH